LKKAFLVLLLLILSCVPRVTSSKHVNTGLSEIKTIYIDAKFDQRERYLIAKGINNWLLASKGIVLYNIQYNYDFNNIYKNTVNIMSFYNINQVTEKQPQKIEPSITDYVLEIGTNPLTSTHHGLDKIWIIKTSSDAQVIKRIEECKHHEIVASTFEYDGAEIIVMVSDRLEDDLRYEIAVTHELGHTLLGPVHNNKTNSVMHEFVDKGAPCITENDIKAFCVIYNCKPEDLNSCNK